MRNFKIEAEGAEFEFLTMSVREVRLFQVYVTHKGLRHRFHMQRNDEGYFHITNKGHCPAQYHKAEDILAKGIEIYVYRRSFSIDYSLFNPTSNIVSTIM